MLRSLYFTKTIFLQHDKCGETAFVMEIFILAKKLNYFEYSASITSSSGGFSPSGPGASPASPVGCPSAEAC